MRGRRNERLDDSFERAFHGLERDVAGETIGDHDVDAVGHDVPALHVAHEVAVAGLEGVVAVKEGGYLADPSLKATQDILQSTPDLNVITTTSDPMTEGAEQAPSVKF